MAYTNIEMKAMLESLEPLMERCDKLGYAAARNTRILADQLREYTAFEEELVRKHGEEEKDEEGNPNGRVSLSLLSPNFAEFLKEIDPIAKVEHEPDLMKLKYEEAIGQLSGKELLGLDWMFED